MAGINFTILILVVTIYFVTAQIDKSKWKSFVCTGGFYMPNPEQMEAMAYCMDPAKNKYDKMHIHCGQIKCMTGDVFGKLHGNQTITKEVYYEWIEQTFPSNYITLAKDHFKECIDKFGSKIVFSEKEEDCKVAADYLACCFEVLPKLPC